MKIAFPLLCSGMKKRKYGEKGANLAKTGAKMGAEGDGRWGKGNMVGNGGCPKSGKSERKAKKKRTEGVNKNGGWWEKKDIIWK